MLLDTSGLFCLLDATQPFHKQAVAEFDSADRRFVHNYILAELVALGTARSLPRRAVLRFAQALAHDRSINTVWVSQEVHQEAMALLAARLDKSYSLCDAVSFVLMRRQQIDRALTTDHHFEQEQFTRLLK